MSNQLQLLFTPLQLRKVTLRNRIVFLQHGNGLADHEFLPTERQAYYFAERAKGGAAVIILGASLVLKNAMSYFGRNLVSDKRAIPGRQGDIIRPRGVRRKAKKQIGGE